jgi:hypothetical protein
MPQNYCPNCGTAVTFNPNQSKAFCPNCGTAVDAPESALESPKRKFPKSIVTIAVAAVVVVALALVAVNALSGGGYKGAEMSAVKSAIEPLLKSFEGKGRKLELDVDYKAGANVVAETDGMLESLGFSGTISAFEVTALADFILSLNGDDINGSASYTSEVATLSLPDFTDYYLIAPLYPQDDETLGFLADLDVAKAQKTVAAVLEHYFTVTKSDMEVEKGVELSGGDITVKCDKYTINFTYGMLDAWARFAIKEIRKNKNLMETITLMLEANGAPFDAEEALDELELELEDQADYIDADERLFRMSVWVKGNEILGRDIDHIIELSDLKFSYRYLENNSNKHLNISVTTPYDGVGSLKGDLKKEGGAWNGTLKFTVSDDSSYYGTDAVLTLKFSDLKVSGSSLDSMKYEGTIKATTSGTLDGDSVEGVNVTLKFSNDGKGQTIVLSGNAMDVDIGKLTLTYKIDSIGSLKLPKLDEDLGIIFDDDSRDNIARSEAFMEEWDANLSKLEAKLQPIFDSNELYEEFYDNVIYYFIDALESPWYYYG